jgi:hypothetical protein
MSLPKLTVGLPVCYVGQMEDIYGETDFVLQVVRREEFSPFWWW